MYGTDVRPSGFARGVWAASAIAISLVALFLLVQAVGQVLLVVFGGILFGIFLNGLSVRLAEATSLPRWLMLTVVILVLAGLLMAFLVFGVPNVVTQISKLTDELDNAVQRLREQVEGIRWAEAAVRGAPTVNDVLGDTGAAMSSAGRVFAGVSKALTAVAIIVFVGIYYAVSPGLYRYGTSRLLPPHERERTQRLMSEIGDRMWWWMIGRLISMLVIGVFSWVGLWMLGVPLAFVLGVLAALLTFVPNIGAILAVIPPMLIAAEVSLYTSLYVLIYYLVLQSVESYIITPLVQKRAIQMPPVLLLTAQAIMAVLAGVIGVVLAAPLTAVAMLLTRRLYVEQIEENDGDKQAAAAGA